MDSMVSGPERCEAIKSVTNSDFPTAGFVQDAVTAYFADAGFEFGSSAGCDIDCVAADSDVRWIVEAIGGPEIEITAFYCRLGRLLVHMGAESNTNHVLAVPALPEYERECLAVPDLVRRKLNLWWYLVERDGSVLPVAPARDIVSSRINAR